jgi:pimeloyl-ACP methyl ester carboxylesterase
MSRTLDAEEFLIEAHGRRYQALAWGEESGEPVLATHGWMDNAASFAALAPLLDGWRVVAIDLPGHGRSEPIAEGGFYHYIDHVWDLHAVLDGLGWQQVTLLGHSMGGALSSLYAGTLPERVKKLITIDALGPIWDTPEQFPQRLRDGLEARARHKYRQRFFEHREQAVNARHADGNLSPQAAELLATRGIERTEEGWTWCVDRRHRLPSVIRMTEPQIAAVISAIQAPTLVVGARDTHYQVLREMLKKRVRQVPRGRLVELDGGHHLHLDQPEAVARVIRAFRDDPKV